MLEFDSSSHTYRVGGVVVPSVTQILSPLVDFSMVTPDVLAAKAAIGTAVHLACELYDMDDLIEDDLDPVLVPYFEGWKKFRLETGYAPLETEQRVYHPKLSYAGTFDSYGELNGKLTMIDRKTSASISDATVGPQTAAYAEAKKAMPGYDGPKKLQRAAIQLRPDGTYKIHLYTDDADWSVFVSLLTILNHRRKHGL